MHPASEDDDSPKSVSCVTKDNDFTCSSNKQRERSHSTSSSTSSTSSISSLFESSLALLGSLPVATSLSSSGKPIIHLSKQNGNFKLYLNSSIENFNEIQLQSHLLWPSSPRLAELMEDEEAKTKDGEIGIKGERGEFHS